MSMPNLTAPRLSPRRLTALGRSELTLLRRNRAALSMALLMPAAMVFLLRSTLADADERSAAALGRATLSGGIGLVLLLVVYMNLVSAYVARREELVLKRLRTGEAGDLEILAGTALRPWSSPSGRSASSSWPGPSPWTRRCRTIRCS